MKNEIQTLKENNQKLKDVINDIKPIQNNQKNYQIIKTDLDSDKLAFIKNLIINNNIKERNIAKKIRNKLETKYHGYWTCFIFEDKWYDFSFSYISKTYLQVKFNEMIIFIYKSYPLPDGEPWDKPEIIQSFMKDKEMENKIMDLIKNENENNNDIDDICKNISNKLDSIYSNYYWQVIAYNSYSGVSYIQRLDDKYILIEFRGYNYSIFVGDIRK